MRSLRTIAGSICRTPAPWFLTLHCVLWTMTCCITSAIPFLTVPPFCALATVLRPDIRAPELWCLWSQHTAQVRILFTLKRIYYVSLDLLNIYITPPKRQSTQPTKRHKNMSSESEDLTVTSTTLRLDVSNESGVDAIQIINDKKRDIIITKEI